MKLKIIYIFLLSFFLISCKEHITHPTTTETLKYSSRATSYHLQGQYRAAMIEARNALKYDNQNPEALTLMAKILAETGNKKQALNALDELELNKNNDAFITYVHILIDSGKAKSALSMIRNLPEHLSEEQRKLLELYKAKALSLTGNFNASKTIYEDLRSSVFDEIAVAAHVGLAALAFTSGDTTSAYNTLEAAMTRSPNDIDALLLKATLTQSQKKFDEAEALLTQALINLPTTDLLTVKRATVLENLIKVLTLRGRAAEALVYNKMLSDSNPDHVSEKAIYEETKRLMDTGHYRDAELKILSLYNTSNTPDHAGTLLGIIKMYEGDPESATYYFSQHVDPETAAPDLLRLMVDAQLMLNQPQAALKILESNISHSADSPELAAVTGLVALTEGDASSGIAKIKKALEAMPDRTDLRLALIDFYLQKGQIPSAHAEINIAMQKFPDDLHVRQRWIQVLTLSHQENIAAQEIKRLEKEMPYNPDAMAIVGAFHFQNGNQAEANAAFSKALSINEIQTDALVGKALLAIRTSDWDAASEWVSKLVEVEPNNLKGYDLLEIIAQHTGTTENYTKQLIKKSDADKSIWATEASLAKYYLEKDDIEKARRHIDEALHRRPYGSHIKSMAKSIYISAAKKALMSQNLREASIYTHKALQCAPYDPEALAMMAHVEMSLRNFDEVDKIVANLRNVKTHHNLADLIEADRLQMQGDRYHALIKLQQLWQSQPSDAIATKIAPLLADKDREAFLAKWLTTFPDSSRAHLQQAMLHQGRGDIEAATRGYLRVLQLDPADAKAMNNLAWINLERNEMREALAYSTKAFEISPNDPAVLDTHGWILFKSGDKKNGIVHLSKALTLAPDVQEVRQHYQEAIK